MKKAPTIYTLKSIQITKDWPLARIDNIWIPARPVGYYSLMHRIRAAILAFTGKADIVIWPGDQ